MARIFSASELPPFKEGGGRVFTADELTPIDEPLKSTTPPAGMGAAFEAGFMQQDFQPQGFGEKAARFAGEIAPPAFGAIAGTPGGPAGMAVGAAAGESVRQTVRAAMGEDVGALEAITKPAKEAALQYTGAKYIGPMVGKAINKLAKGFADNIAKPAMAFLSKVPEDQIQRAYDKPSQVWAMVGKDQSDISNSAKTFVALVNDNINAASTRYAELVDLAVKSGKYSGLKFNLKADMAPVITETRKSFGYGLKGRIGDKAEAKVFQEFAEATNKLDKASIEDVYFLQRDINNAIRRAEGKPLSAALGKLKSAVNARLSQEAPEIAQANALYAKAMDSAEDFARLLRTETPATAIRQAQVKQSTLWDDMVKFADETAAGRKALDDFFDTEAGVAMTKVVPKMGQSGFYPTIGLVLGGLTATAGPGVGALGAITTVPFFSPRLTGIAAMAARGAVEAAKVIGPKVVTPVAAAAVSPMLPDPESIKAAYKSGKLSKVEAAQMLREQHGFK
jgi:hypothetical protein